MKLVQKFVFFLFFSVFLLSSSNLFASKKADKKNRNDNLRKKEVCIFSVSAINNKGKIFFENLNNQVYFCFSNLKGLQVKFAGDMILQQRFLKNLFFNLQLMASYKIVENKKFKPAGISLEDQKNLSDKYAIIIPSVREYSFSQSIDSIVKSTNQSGIISTTTNYLFKLKFNVVVRVMSPVMEQNFNFAPIKKEMSGSNKIDLWFKAVSFIGGRLATMAENHSIFDTETKINYVSDNNIFFLNKNKFNPSIGDEFSYYQAKRYPDGYVDDVYRGVLRIKGKVGHLWQARAICGRKPTVLDNIHLDSHAGFNLDFFMRGYMIDFPDDIFSSSSGIDWVNNDYQLIQGLGMRLGFELGFRIELFLEGIYFLDSGIDLLQANLGFSLNFFVTRNFFFQYSLNGVVRYYSCNYGTVSDGSEHDGKKVRAFAFSPGAETSFSLNLLLFRSFVVLRVVGGYNYMLPLKGENWNFSVANSSIEYEPDNVKKVSLGGPFASASLGFRF